MPNPMKSTFALLLSALLLVASKARSENLIPEYCANNPRAGTTCF